MDPRPGMIIHNGALYHGHSTRDSANPDEEMLEQVVFVEDQEEGDEDEDMTPKYYSFDETSETGTSTPGSTHVEFPAHQQGYAEDEAGFEDEDMEPKYKGMLPSGSSTHNVHSRPSDSSENAAKKTRYHPSSVAPSFERGPSKRRSGQTVTANQQLMSTLKTRQEQHEHDLAEVKETYSRYVSRLEEEARKKEQAHQEEWNRVIASVAENGEAVKIEKQRASRLALAVHQKDQIVEEIRLRALQNEKELWDNMLAMQRDNEELRTSQGQVQKEMAEQIELLKRNSQASGNAVPDAQRNNDLAAIRAFVQQKEADALAERNRAEAAEAALLQKDLEIAAARQREEQMKETIESMKRVQEEFHRSQQLSQQTMLTQIEQIKADKDREVAIALQQKQRMKASLSSTHTSAVQSVDGRQHTSSNSTHHLDVQPMDEDLLDSIPPVSTAPKKSGTPSTLKGQTQPMTDKPAASTSPPPNKKSGDGATGDPSTPGGKAVMARIKAKRGQAVEEDHPDSSRTPTSTASKKKADAVAQSDAEPSTSNGEPQPMDEDLPIPNIPPPTAPKEKPADYAMAPDGAATKSATGSSGKGSAGPSASSGKGFAAPSVSSGKELMERIRSKKHALQGKNIPVLKRATAIEDNEADTSPSGHDAGADADADSEHKSDSESEDSDEEMDESPSRNKGKRKGTGKGKGASTGKDSRKDMFANLEGLIAGAVRQAVADLAPNLGMTITPSPPAKKSRQSIKNAAVTTEAKKHSKDVKNGFSEIICSVIHGVFDFESNDDWYMHEPPSPDTISQFINSGGAGPDPGDLRVDMKGSISSKWNIAVIQILLALVIHELKDKDSKWLPKVSEDFLRSRIRKRIENGRAFWNKTKPKVAEDGTTETAQEVEDRLVRDKATADAKARAHARRVTKYETRCKIVDYIVARKIEAGGSEDDIALWKWLALLLRRLT